MLLTEAFRDIAEKENLIHDATGTPETPTVGEHDYGQITLSEDSLMVFRYTWKVDPT